MSYIDNEVYKKYMELEDMMSTSSDVDELEKQQLELLKQQYGRWQTFVIDKLNEYTEKYGELIDVKTFKLIHFINVNDIERHYIVNGVKSVDGRKSCLYVVFDSDKFCRCKQYMANEFFDFDIAEKQLKKYIMQKALENHEKIDEYHKKIEECKSKMLNLDKFFDDNSSSDWNKDYRYE